MLRRKWAVPFFASGIMLVLWSTTRHPATQSGSLSYSVGDIGTLGGNTSVALGVSPAGLPYLAGYSQTASGAEHAFAAYGAGVWPPQLKDLGTLGGSRSEARAYDGLRAVGSAQLANGLYHAFVYGGSMTDLGTLGGSASCAYGMNTSAVVGASWTSGDTSPRAFIYQNGAMTDVGATLGGPNTVATAINTAGHVAGYADLAGGQTHHAFLYRDGSAIDLGSFGGSSEGAAINSNDVVVGRSDLVSGTIEHAFRYQNGSMADLGTLGGNSSEALAVNGSGDVVGWANTPSGDRHAFIWRSGVMSDLNTLIPSDTGWVLQGATGIQDAGAIVGYGQFQGQLRAFFLTPPIDLALSIRLHKNLLDTNVPNPHEAGQRLTLGDTVTNYAPYTATGVTIHDTLSGPVEIVGWSGAQSCVQDGLQLTCTLPPTTCCGSSNDFFIQVRSTAAGAITHTSTLTADQPDPNLTNNSESESNTAVSLASLTLNPTTVIGGSSSLGRATLTSSAPYGGAPIALTTNRPDLVSLPSPFGVLRGCCDDGLWREFYATTQSVASPVTVEVNATYGLVTKTVPLTLMPAGSPFPFGGSAWTIPGTIEAEDFDEGGEGVGYHDVDSGNNGAVYRFADVDIEATADSDGGYDVGWMSAGEWLNYSVAVAQPGTYTLTARVAANGAGGTFHVEFGGVDKTGPLIIPNTESWQSWRDLTATVSLASGPQSMRVVLDSNGPTGVFGNLNYVRLSAPSGGSTPFGGVPRAIPGTIQAEDFDDGGEGVSYHDVDAGNNGGAYRPTDVDIEPSADAEGGYNVGWMTAGEWMNYTVSIGQAGTYTLTARVAANGPGGTFHVEFGGVDKTGPLTIQNTESWQSWTDVTAIVSLTGGTQLMRVVEDTNGPTGVFGNINFIRITNP